MGCRKPSFDIYRTGPFYFQGLFRDLDEKEEQGVNKLQLPARRNYTEAWGDEELDLLTRLVYHPFFGLFFRHRFSMALRLLPGSEKLMEVGCGYGLLLPSLSKKTNKLYAVDVHPYMEKVKKVITAEGVVNVALSRGSIFELPYEDKSFDSVVCLSVLEQLAELEKPVCELWRVLEKNGTLVVGVPVKNAITRILFRWVNRDDDVIHPQSHTSILGALKRYFNVRKTKVFPAFFPPNLGFYFVIECVKRG